MQKLAATLNPHSSKKDTHAPAPQKAHSYEDTSKKGTKSLTKSKLVSSKSTKIPRNVNFYRHLLNDTSANEHGIEWALQLRSPPSTTMNIGKPEPTTTAAFAVSDKTLECQNQKKRTLDIDNSSELHHIIHLVNHRMGPTASKGQVNFEAGLRSYGSASENLKTLEKRWSNIPKREHLWQPVQMYPSYEETRRLHNWSTKNFNIKTHSAFDSLTNYPKYGLVKEASKNIAQLKHLLTEKGQSVPTMNWECSMRNYESTNKLKLPEVTGETGEHAKGSKRPSKQ